VTGCSLLNGVNTCDICQSVRHMRIKFSSFDAKYFDQKIDYQIKLSLRVYFFFKFKIYSVKTNGSNLQNEPLHSILIQHSDLIFTGNVRHFYQLHTSKNM
jgi:hypothetical protein